MNTLNRHAFVLVVIFALLLFPLAGGARPAQAQPPAGLEDPVELGAFLDGAVAGLMASNHVPGAVVAVVKDGQVFYEKGYGYADVAKNIPVDPRSTLFRPGSVSKLFTFTAVMQLVEQGKLSLDEDVNAYLDYTIPATYPQPVTLKHLLTHTPGFEDAGQDLFVLDPSKIISLGDYLKTHIPTRVYPPGAVIAYSNYGAAMAGYIVERVSGMPFDEYVAQNIFQPLGMAHSTFTQPLPAALAADMSGGYNYMNGQYHQGAFEIVIGSPAGALSATADDLARFMIAHLQNGQYENARILSEATARQMHAPLFRQEPRLHGMAHGFFENVVNGQVVLSHGGDTILFHTGLYLLTEHNVGFYISTNSTGGSDVVQGVFQAFMDRYYPVAPQAEPAPPADFASRALKYAGEYYASRSNYSSIEKIFRIFSAVKVTPAEQGRVMVNIPGLGTYRYVEAEPGYLVSKEGPAPAVVLQEAADGQVSLLLTFLPWSLIKAPWYATSTVAMLIFGGGMLLFLIALVRWVGGGLAGLLRRPRQIQPPRMLPRLARIVAGLFMLLFIIVVVGLLSIMADIDPAYGNPRMIFETVPAMEFLIRLVPVLAVLGLLTLPFVFLAWKDRYWTTSGRVFYTLLAAWFVAVVWAMWFWNFL